MSVGLSQDTNQIQLSNDIARLVVTDLINGDSAKEQIRILSKEADLLLAKVTVKDSIIKKKNDIISNYEEIIGSKNKQITLSSELSTQLQKDLKKQKAQTKLFKMGTGGILLGALVLSLL